jgi:ABC-type antimicrobial peptide transport system permease subunit
MNGDESTDETLPEQPLSPWVWRGLIGLVLSHIVFGIASELTGPSGLSDILTTIAGIAAGLAVIISVASMYRIYATRRSTANE